MKIVISGGLGYVGGRLSKFLAEQGHDVVSLSRQAHALPPIDLPKNMRVLHPEEVMQQRDELKGADVLIQHDAMK
jgi:nucleoside-diphosphate-sugar epimerase